MNPILAFWNKLLRRSKGEIADIASSKVVNIFEGAVRDLEKANTWYSEHSAEIEGDIEWLLNSIDEARVEKATNAAASAKNDALIGKLREFVA